ncbi:ABC transporter permease [Pseudonocardia endophytica]|uniref:Sulfonate transport system permease protein n=1 Tax=Pseudonocardia endophytica TaxID=401976 RepID=A0A4R1HXU5_PSEEN|nr:ABC transporter permease [Pseudonocardia endophytica]TCK26321.1 sulfonate transport system permease protein [Pseudonocardia endophytica]
MVAPTALSSHPDAAATDEGAVPPLDDLSPSGLHRRSRTWSAWRGRILRVAVPAALIAVWQLSGATGLISEYVLPSPQTVLGAFGELWSGGDIQAALPVSLHRAGVGLAIGVSIGLVLGLFAGLWAIGEEIFDAPMQMLRTIPFIAVVPLFVTWFGIGEEPKIILIAAATVFPVYLNTYHGVRGVDKKLVEAGLTFGLRGWRLSTRVVLPTALPSVLTGLRYATGISLLALVLAEQINAREGIGYVLINANQNQRPDIVIAGILIYALLGIVADVVMRWVEHLALPWRPRVTLG